MNEFEKYYEGYNSKDEYCDCGADQKKCESCRGWFYSCSMVVRGGDGDWVRGSKCASCRAKERGASVLAEYVAWISGG